MRIFKILKCVCDFLLIYIEIQQFRGKRMLFPHFCQQLLGNLTSSPIGWQLVFGHFQAASLYPLTIAQRLSDSFWAFPSGFSIPC